MTLTEFVLARIAEREAVAQHGIEELDPGQTELKVTIWDLDTHIRYRPHYELARCAVDRQIVEFADEVTVMGDRIESEWGSSTPAEDAGDVLLRLLASLDANHPDYDEDWKP